MIEEHPLAHAQLPLISSEEDAVSDGNEANRTDRLKHLFRDRARVAGSAMLILVALLLAWDVIYGQNGLSAWSAKRAHDRVLTEQVERLRQENETLRHQNERLLDDPAAIEYQARQNLHYARPNEVIFAMPVASQPSGQNTGSGSSSASSH